MKNNESNKKINSQKYNSKNLFNHELIRTEKMKKKEKENLLLKRKDNEIEKSMIFSEKIKFGKKNYFNKKLNMNSNSQLLLYKSKNEKAKLSNNIEIYRNKEILNQKNNNIIPSRSNSGLNNSGSINNLKNIFPIIESKKNKNLINSNINDLNNSDKEKKKIKKLKFPISDRIFFNNFYKTKTKNIISIKHSNDFINYKENINNNLKNKK